MPVHSASEILDALNDGRDDEIVGTEESSWCDFKSQPYDLDTPYGRWELSKDVSALANALGGVIVVAVRTEKPEGRDEEVAAEVRPVPRSRIDRKRYQDIIRERTYPPLGERVRLELFDRGDDKVLFVIEVSSAAEDQLPVLIYESTTDNDDRRHVFSVGRRVGAHTEWIPIGQIHRDISDGRIARQRVRTRPEGTVPDSDRIEQRLDAIDDFMGWQALGVYGLSAVPPLNSGISDFYAREGIKGILEKLGDRTLRWAGFGLGYGLEVRAVGECLVTADKDRIVWIDPDGFSTCATAVTDEFLGWAQERHSRVTVDGKLGLRINETVLVEYTFEFCRLVTEELMPRVAESGWTLAVSARRFKSGEQPAVLSAQNWLSRQADTAVVDGWSKSFEATNDPELDAFMLLASVYERFGLGADRIPFAGERRILRNSIAAIGNEAS